MKLRTLLLLGGVTAISTGCQFARHRTPGEQIVMAPPPVTQPTTTVATAEAPVASAPVTPLAVPPVTSNDKTTAVVTTPATTPATMMSADRTPRIYVAADADDATLFRNWQPVINPYPNGNVLAGPTYRINPPPPRSDRWNDVFAIDLFQTVLSVPQMVATPLWMLGTKPLTPVEYHGEQYPPSYTVDDPLPYYADEKIPGMIQMKRDK